MTELHPLAAAALAALWAGEDVDLPLWYAADISPTHAETTPLAARIAAAVIREYDAMLATGWMPDSLHALADEIEGGATP